MHDNPDLGQVAHATRDALELRNRMSDFAVPHTIEPLSGHVEGLTTGVRLGDTKLAFVKYGVPTRVVAHATKESLCWTIPVGPMQVELDRRRLALREGFLLDRDQPTTMLPSPVRGAVVVTTNEASLQAHLTKLLGRDAPPLRFVPGPSTATSKGQIDLAWRYVAGSLSLTPRPPEAVLPSLGETLLTALLFELPQSARLLAEDEPLQRPGRQHAQRAAEWAAAHFTLPVRISDWASGISISVRHLQATIQTEFGCTPKEYLLALRLERAHALLRSSSSEKTITSIATASGFTHFGRFAALYRERYGVNPASDRGKR